MSVEEPQAYIEIVKPLPEGNEIIGRVELEDIKDGLVLEIKRADVAPIFYTDGGIGALSLTTTIGADYGVVLNLRRVSVTFPTAPTTSQNLTLTLIPLDPARPATVFLSADPASDLATNELAIWDEGEGKLAVGDELILAYTNTDGEDLEAVIVLERA